MKIECGECGYINEPQRIYCHNCGTKLDRSVLPSDFGRGEVAEKVVRRVRAMVDPQPGFGERVVKPLLLTLALAALAAAVVLMCRPPYTLPEEPDKEAAIEARVLLGQLEDLVGRPGVQRVAVAQPLANQYLMATLRPQATGLIKDECKFVGARVAFGDGVVWVWAQCSVFDYPFYFGIAHQIAVEGGKLNAKVVGGSVGRLPLYPVAVIAARRAFGPLWGKLKIEKGLVDQMQAVAVTEGKVEFVTRGAGPAPR